MKTLLFSILTFCFVSCSVNDAEKPLSVSTKSDEAKLLNHEILNDSIHYKIIEVTKNRKTNRTMQVYNIEKLVTEKKIYETNETLLLDEGYNKTTQLTYTISDCKTELTQLEIAHHYYDYHVESSDTSRTQLRITESGKIKVQPLRHQETRKRLSIHK